MIKAVKEGWLGGEGSSISPGDVEYWSDTRRIIAMKGIPCTGKSEIAMRIGQWARCPVVSLDDFLQAVSMEKGYTAESPPPSGEEADRLRRLALYALYKTADRHLSSYSYVVIKSRLCSEFELDLLMWLAKENKCPNLVIVECKAKQELDLRERLGDVLSQCRKKKYNSDLRSRRNDLRMHRLKHPALDLCQHRDWYKARNWRDIEKAMDVHYSLESRAHWDRHLLHLLHGYDADPPCVVTRLLLDPFDELNLPYTDGHHFFLPPDFLYVIGLLLHRHKHLKAESEEGSDQEAESEEGSDQEAESEEGSDQEAESEEEGRYWIVKYNELRRTLVKIELSKSIGSRKKSRYLCNATKQQSCVFKYWNKVPAGFDSSSCGVCEQQLDPGEPAYTCHYCILALHKPCATVLDFNFLKHTQHQPGEYVHYFPYAHNLMRHEEKEPCESCIEARKHFSDECMSCLFQTHLKRKLFPTIVNHDSHPHPLSILFTPEEVNGALYGCYICKFYRKIEFIFLPGQVKDEHGGYQHVMNLMYSLDGIAPENDYWCHDSYEDMRPDAWFYSCQNCPYYVFTANAKEESLREAVENRNLAIRHYEPICRFTPDMLKADDD